MRSIDVAVPPLLAAVAVTSASVMSHVVEEQRAQLGQFMTPPSVAQLMSSMFRGHVASVRLLDPGAGTGSLTAAYVTLAASARRPPREIAVTAVELDDQLIPHLESTLHECATYCRRSGINFTSRVINGDFLSLAAKLRPVSEPGDGFNRAIMNPPYRKIGIASEARRLAAALGVETSNLYSAFVVAAISCLARGGQLVAITPRSFCNGSYFLGFRRFLLTSLSLDSIHLFESRKAAFSQDDVLQENVIFHGVKGAPTPVTVRLTVSAGPASRVSTRVVPFARVVQPSDPAAFIRIAADEKHDRAASTLRRFGQPLRALGVSVSTGRVVDFRAREHLSAEPGPGRAPLIYPQHFDHGRITWPSPTSRKANAIAIADETSSLLIRDGIYVVVRRFSAKEEPRRVVAAVYEPVSTCSLVGFENHLNYFHHDGEPLERELAWGLALYLNSTVVDTHFREFNGHTQVNAGDLRSLAYPSRDQLSRLGTGVSHLPAQGEVDRMVESLDY